MSSSRLRVVAGVALVQALGALVVIAVLSAAAD